jgi:hypothetical protein
LKRSICIWLGVAVISVLTMFPPWAKTRVYEGRKAEYWRLAHSREDISPQVGPPEIFYADIDYRRMLTEIGVGESFVLALYLTWGRTRKTQ